LHFNTGFVATATLQANLTELARIFSNVAGEVQKRGHALAWLTKLHNQKLHNMSLFVYDPFVPQRHVIHNPFMALDVPRFHLAPVRRYVNPWPVYQRRSLIDEMLGDLLDFTDHVANFVNEAPSVSRVSETLESKPVAQEVAQVEDNPLVKKVEDKPGEQGEPAEDEHAVEVAKPEDYSIKLPLGKVMDGVKEDFKVKVNPAARSLSVKVTRRFEDKDTKSYSSYSRSWTLPPHVNVEKLAETAKAELVEGEDGIRTLQVNVGVPKLLETKEIPVQVKPTRSITGDATLSDEQPVDTTQPAEPADDSEDAVEEIDSE